MLKKIFRYLGLLLGLATCLPIFIATWTVSGGIGDKFRNSTSYKLFEGSFIDAAKVALGDKFAPFWFTLFQILVIVMLVLSVVMLVVYLLNDLRVIKAQKLEKLLSIILAVVGVLALVTVLIVVLTQKTEGSLTGAQLGSISGAVMAWLAPVFALVGGVLACACASEKSKKKKKK